MNVFSISSFHSWCPNHWLDFELLLYQKCTFNALSVQSTHQVADNCCESSQTWQRERERHVYFQREKKIAGKVFDRSIWKVQCLPLCACVWQIKSYDTLLARKSFYWKWNSKHEKSSIQMATVFGSHMSRHHILHCKWKWIIKRTGINQ